ncbi:MAG TPA: hypothetical protein PLJ27_27215, partial [Polyangiaceae bacterium]|nr:hypothetical protein [Polyangiaceae bacterium]
HGGRLNFSHRDNRITDRFSRLASLVIMGVDRVVSRPILDGGPLLYCHLHLDKPPFEALLTCG